MATTLPAWEEIDSLTKGFAQPNSVQIGSLGQRAVWEFLRDHPWGLRTGKREEPGGGFFGASLAGKAGLELRRFFSPEQAGAILNQWELRAQARGKFVAPENLIFTRAGLEQATRGEVACHRAQLFARAGASLVVDLGCGLGADSLALQREGVSAWGVELDPDTAFCAAVNFAGGATGTDGLGAGESVALSEVRSRVFNADALGFSVPAGAGLFCDPARRVNGRRVLDPFAWVPSFAVVREWARERSVWGAKLAPGIAHGLLGADWHVQWASVEGALVEAAAYSSEVAGLNPGRSAVVWRGGRKLVFEVEGVSRADGLVGEVPVRPGGEFLFEVDDALLRCGGLAQVARWLDAGLVSAGISYLSCDGLDVGPGARWRDWGCAFRVVEEFALRAKRVAAGVRARGIGVLEVKKRGVEVSPEDFRRRVLAGSKGGASAVLVLTRVAGEHRALLCERV